MMAETRIFFPISILLIILLAFIFSSIFIIFIKLYKIIPIFFLVPLIFISVEYIISMIFYGFDTFSLIISSSDYLLFFLRNFGTLVTSYIVVQIFCIPYLLFSTESKKIIFINSSFLVTIPLMSILVINLLNEKSYESESKKLDLEIFQLNLKNSNSEYILDKNFNEIINSINKSKGKF